MSRLVLTACAALLALSGCASLTGGQPTELGARPPSGSTASAPAGPAPVLATPAPPSPPAIPAARPRPSPPLTPPGPQAMGSASESLSPIAPTELARSAVAATRPPAHLWERIQRGYRMPDLDVDLVRTHEQWYAKRPEYINRMVDRSRKYLFHIVEEVERRGMPSELALLPFIESAFNPQAVSSAKAAGMWQFMRATGKDYQLKQSVFRDDRRDVLASTRAALDYLQRLHGMFGDWQLALAAYNWGEGNVSRAIARSQRAGGGSGYLDISMPVETRNYVPKLQAVKNLVADPKRLGVELPEIANHPYFQTVTINRDIDVALAARLADVRLEDFQSLNPSHHRPVILASGNPTILLPWDNAETFERNYQTYNAGPLASWTAWNVPDTMSVAELAKRVGMQEGTLRAVNTIPPRMLVRAGSVVLVPRSAKAEADVSSQVANNGQLSLSPERVAKKGKAKPAAQARKASGGRKGAPHKQAPKPNRAAAPTKR